MNTLGSWIDQEAFTGLAKEIAPPPKNLAQPWFAEDAGPVTRLLAEDFRAPGHFASASFPEAPPPMAGPERAKVRSLLDNIRQKAQSSGLIPTAGHSGTALSHPADGAPGVKPAVGLSLPEKAPGALTSPGPIPAPGFPAEAGVSLPPRRHVPHFEVPLGPLTTRLRALTDWIRRQIDAADIFIIDAQGCPVSDRQAPGDIVAGALLLAEAARRAAPHLPSATEGAIYLDLQDERRLCVIDTSTRHGLFTLTLIVPDALAPRAADRLRRALRRTVESENQPPPQTPRERW